jgi:predicted small secreted protein
MTILIRKVLLALMLVSLGALAACNTVEGAGKDIQSGGRAVEDAGD